MLEFTATFVETGKYKGTDLNRGRCQTRRLQQARMEQFLGQNMEDDFLITTFKESFSPITNELICFFSIFDYQQKCFQ